MNIKTQRSTKFTWMMGGIGDGLRPIYTSPITINTFSVIVKIILSGILIPTPKSYIITPTVTFYIFMKTIINTTIINRYTQQYTIFAWFIGGIVAGIGPISTYPITINIFLHIAKVRVYGIFIPISTSSVINISITSLVTIITTSISPPVTIIVTDITPPGTMTAISYYLFTMNIFVNRTRRN